MTVKREILVRNRTPVVELIVSNFTDWKLPALQTLITYRNYVNYIFLVLCLVLRLTSITCQSGLWINVNDTVLGHLILLG
jgi:hypothetical protein